MILEGRFEYKKALILTPERIKELEIILLKYCERIAYKATTVAETEISFDSADELFSYDNFRKGKIKTLVVMGYIGPELVNSCVFESDSFLFFKGYGRTFKCRFCVSHTEVETTLKEGLSDFLKKVTASYWFIGKIRLLGIITCICWFILFYQWACGYGSNVAQEMNIPLFLILILIAFSFWSILILLDFKILPGLFPPISFVWGEEKSVFSRYEQIRKNIFWCVIVAIIVGIIVGIIVFYITNKLPQ